MNGSHQPHLPLLAFFEAIFLPLQLRNLAAAYAEQFRVALRWAAAAMGRELCLGDLTRETMQAFVNRLSAVGLAGATAKGIRQRVWRIWEFAHQLGYSPEPPATMRRPRVPKYSHHGATGQAYILVNNQKVYLGKHGTEASRQRYAQKIAELFGAAANQAIREILAPPIKGTRRAWAMADPPAGSL